MIRYKKTHRQNGGLWFGIVTAMQLYGLWNQIFAPRELFIREAKGTRRIVF